MSGFWKRCLLLVCLSLTFTSHSQAQEGMVVMKSVHNFSVTANRLVGVLKEKDMTVMNRINHSANGKTVGLDLRPTEVVIFGNPKVGTLLMQCAQTVAIDLPQKVLIWVDDKGDVYLGYNDPLYLKERHGMEGCDPVLEKVSGAMRAFAEAATR